LASVPLIFAMTVLARGPEAPTYITFFFGQWFLNLNWALATDMLMVFTIKINFIKSNYLILTIITPFSKVHHRSYEKIIR
jgi:hypothetical protein